MGDNARMRITVGFASTPAVPEPETETYALMLAGLGLVGFAARRRSIPTI
jgi:MYXO-CTERM domain-containing protein